MQLRRANREDVLVLAQMNWQLIRDEGSDNPMTVEQLASRMTEFLTTTYGAWLIVVDSQPIGYILVDLGRQPVYVRQMYILAPHRRCGHGRMAFALLRVMLGDCPLDVEVFAWNHPAIAFWQAVGFSPRVIQMRRQ